jgi:release factor glutamine methyltransferase
LPNAFEPRHALDGGADGLDIIRRLGGELPAKLKDGGSVFLEIGLGQAAAVGDMLKSSLPLAHVDIFPDLAGIERVMVATLPGRAARR